MSTEKKSFLQTVGSFNKTFWLGSFMELMERWAWYGVFTLFALYLVGSTDKGGLGFNHIQKGNIMSDITALLYFLPIFTGVIADKIGYKLSLIIAYTILITGYLLMGEVNTYWGMYFVFLFVAIGAAMFKPVASAIITKSTNKSNGTLGFGIFYMMVNIGGFIGPASSSYLRSTYGWKLIFIQAAVVIGINLLLVLFFFKEPEREKTAKESFGAAIRTSLLKIWEAVKDTRLTVLLILMVGFWTMFNQLFYTLPNFIEDWVDSSALSASITNFWPGLGNLLSENGQIKPEWFTNIDALMIVTLQMFVSYFVIKMRHVSAMIRGFIIAAIGIGLTFYTNNVMFTILGTMIFAIGEMTTNPTFSSFIALISPKGKEALYQGTYFLPVAAGNFLTKLISGNLYQSWSDKLSLLQTEMTTRGIEMPEITETFTKNDYLVLAEQKLGMEHWEMTQMLWDNYNPNKIWYVIVAIGIITIIALSIYDKMVIRPKEKAELEA
ncbi:MFS transporter [Lutibacter sp. A80]|uniref:MFS transporter n=1 Tax=Lutibacter sp. A80 TaxID=2918453 RepID=UPI001F056B95|nr:MFS transporter [Lutibacter sp. A80]UMB60371.1 MFS transporter [Lutibacter sp. A80]